MGSPAGPERRRWVLVPHPEFWEDLRYWAEHQPRTTKRVLDLLKEMERDPFTGKGKPEPLRYLGPDVWSRRITEEHRLVYSVGNGRVELLQCRYHYE